MHTTKVVIIGAASASFGPRIIADAVLTPELRGSTLTLVDINAEALRVIETYAGLVNQAAGAGLVIEAHTDRTKALPGAEFVVTSIDMKVEELGELDFQIPLRHGIKQVMGENGGPGGLAHSLRCIPPMLDIARDIEKLAPGALLLNLSNPVTRICLALSRYTNVRFAGLCHGIGMAYTSVSKITGIPAEDLQAVAAGLNHFAWLLDIRRKSTKEDVYPLLREADRTYDPSYYPLTRHLFQLYGLYPHPADDHIGEYLSFAHEFCGLDGIDFAGNVRWYERHWQRLQRIVSGQDPVPAPAEAEGSAEERMLEDRPQLTKSGELAFPIIASTLANRHDWIEAVNIRNDGLIPNLPDWAVVEVPAVAGADGLNGVAVGALPRGAAALLNTQVHVQDLVVEAAVHGSRELALQALLADPVVQSAEAAEKSLDELLRVHAEWLPQFQE